MSLWDAFRRVSPLEKRLLEEYSLALELFFDKPTARIMAKEMFDGCRASIQLDGVRLDRPTSGDDFLEMEREDERFGRSAAWKRKEGVTNKDIHWWWDMAEIERRMMLRFDEFHRFVLFEDRKKHGMSNQDAAREVHRYHVTYSNFLDEQFAEGDHVPLPPELKQRVMSVFSMAESDPATFFILLQQAGSANACARSLLRS